MHETRLGGLDIRFVEDHICFSSAGNPDNVLRLDAKLRKQLIEFLDSYHLEKREQRVGFRVPLSPELLDLAPKPLEVSLSINQHTIEAQCKDISLTGVGFELLAAAPDLLTQGSTVQMSVSYGSDSVTIQGLVRRMDTALVGVSFENEIAETEFEPPDLLISVIRQLETLWLRQVRKSS